MHIDCDIIFGSHLKITPNECRIVIIFITVVYMWKYMVGETGLKIEIEVKI